jgi:hypothetical protein
MTIGTGQTVYEQILSVNADNNPVTGATFDTAMYRNGIVDTGTTISLSLTDSTRGVFTAEWSASTTGDYQLYAKNNNTSVIFISDNVIVKSDDELSTNVYIGL